MSNLSDLLPAGGGAKVAEFVASGTLASGQTVALKADGTVEAIASDANSISQTAGAASVFESASADFTSVAYDSSVQRILISYRDQGNSNYGTAVVGTVSGSTITFGTPAIFISTGIDTTSTANVSGDGKFVIANKGSNNGRARVATVSGTSVSFGSDATFVTNNIDYAQVNYDSGNDKIVITWTDGSYEDRGTYIVGTVSGTSISFGSAADFSDSYISYLAVTYEPIQGKLVAVYGIGSNGKARVGVVSGTSMTWGASVVFEPNNKATVNTITCDSTTGQVFVAYRDSNTVYGKIGTIDVTSIQWGVRDTLLTSSTNTFQTVSYHAASKKMIFSCQTGSDVKAVIITTSGTGTSASFTKTNSIALTGTGQDVSSTYDSVNGQVVLAYKGTDEFSVTTGTASTFTPAYTATNFTDFIGITNEAISSAATGEVAVQGGVATNPTEPYTLTAGSPNQFTSSTLSDPYTQVVYDSSNNKIVVLYRDSSNSDYGTAIVGTVSGASISFGSPVIFEAAQSVLISATYDSNSNKVVVCYRDGGNSSYGTAIVGTVSGTSISFGTAAVFQSSSVSYVSSVQDSDTNKTIIAYRDNGNSNYGKSIVGTVSGTSISFGSAATFASSTVQYVSVGYDATNSRAVISYETGTNGLAIVGTVSGTSISFGSAVTFLSGKESFNTTTTFDPSSGKVLIGYSYVYSSAYQGTFGIVGTVSGTSISFGSEKYAFGAGYAQTYTDAVYDPDLNKIILVASSAENSYAGGSIVATISGTSVSFGAIKLFDSARTNYNSIAYDTTSNKSIIAYGADTTGGECVVGTVSNAVTLTPGTDYFVQDDGTLSTTSSSVAAGKAIGSTSLLLKG
jgi:hypothetical protein